MKITINKEDKKLTLNVAGRLDTTTAPQLESMLSENMKEMTKVSLDFTALEYISSAGLRVLLSAHKAMERQEGKLVIQGANKEVQEVFDITGFSDILNIKA